MIEKKIYRFAHIYITAFHAHFVRRECRVRRGCRHSAEWRQCAERFATEIKVGHLKNFYFVHCILPYICLIHECFGEMAVSESRIVLHRNFKWKDGWLVGCFGLTALWDCISVYIGPSPRARETEKRNDRREDKCPTNPNPRLLQTQ